MITTEKCDRNNFDFENRPFIFYETRHNNSILPHLNIVSGFFRDDNKSFLR